MTAFNEELSLLAALSSVFSVPQSVSVSFNSVTLVS